MAFAQNELFAFDAGFGGLPNDVVLGGVGGIELLPFIPFLLTSASGYEAAQDLTCPRARS